jgi:uncharacterized protein (DUF58 family)
MPGFDRQTFPLVPRRRRLVGLPFGDLPSRRRGHGGDVIGSRPYAAGDPVSTIDWFATARLSAVSGGDAFVVRDRSADEAPRVVLLCDRRPAMGIYPTSLPFLEKPRALVEAALSIVASATAARSDVAALDLANGGEPFWLPPGRRDRTWLVGDRFGAAPFTAPDDNVERALTFLGGMRGDLPPGTFVFVLSDFIVAPPATSWVEAVAHGWDVVPVVIQDPVWEQSFPDVAGIAVPFIEPGGRRRVSVRLTAREVAARRDANEQRLRALVSGFEAVDLDPVLVSTTDRTGILAAFLEWSDGRRARRAA